MQPPDALRIGYVVKRYPRFSETFIVNEIVAHERAGLPVHIFAVRRVNEAHFQSMLAQVRSPVVYISDSMPKAESLWLTFREGEAAFPDFWTVLQSLNAPDVADVYQAVLLALQARKHGINHLHAHFGTIATTVARLAARFAGIGYSFTAHAKDIFHAEVDAEQLREKLQDATNTVTVSDFNLQWLRQRYGAAAAGTRRIYNGLDLQALSYRPPADREREIVAVGRLVEKKGFDTLVDACAVLRSRDIRFRCTIVGDGVLRGDLEAQIRRLALSDQVVLAGSRPQAEVIDALYGAAVFAAPCTVADDGDRDGLPTVLLEAMALGTPCVATDVTGIPEIVRDGETGLVVPQRDPVALAEAIVRLLDDEPLRIRLAAQARRLVEDDFDIDKNAATMRAIFSNSLVDREGLLRVAG